MLVIPAKAGIQILARCFFSPRGKETKELDTSLRWNDEAGTIGIEWSLPAPSGKKRSYFRNIDPNTPRRMLRPSCPPALRAADFASASIMP
jgi:hypothetical protein